MPVYDVAAIARRQTSNKKMNKLTSRLAKDLKKRGGVIRKVHHYGHRPLAYPIRRKGQKHDVGRYCRFFVQASPQALKEFLGTLRLDEDVIRFKPFKLSPNELLDLYTRPPFTHKPKISEAHFDALKRTTNINYYIARTLVLQDKMSREEIEALGTTPIQFEPYFRSREQDLAEKVFQYRTNQEAADAIDSDLSEFEGMVSESGDERTLDRQRLFDQISDFTELSDEGHIQHQQSYDTLKDPEYAHIQFSDDSEEAQGKNAV